MTSPRDAEELFDPDAHRERDEDKFIETPKTNDPAKLREKATKDTVKQLQRENDLKAVLGTEQGVRMLAFFLEEFCGYRRPYWTGNYGEMSNIAGRRQVGGQIEEWVKNCGLHHWFKVETELEKTRPKPKTSEPKKQD